MNMLWRARVRGMVLAMIVLFTLLSLASLAQLSWADKVDDGWGTPPDSSIIRMTVYDSTKMPELRLPATRGLRFEGHIADSLGRRFVWRAEVGQPTRCESVEVVSPSPLIRRAIGTHR